MSRRLETREGNSALLDYNVTLAETDWRDVLVFSGLGDGVGLPGSTTSSVFAPRSAGADRRRAPAPVGGQRHYLPMSD